MVGRTLWRLGLLLLIMLMCGAGVVIVRDGLQGGREAKASLELLNAIAKSDAVAVRKSLVNGAAPDFQGAFGDTPLLVAVQRGHLEIVQVLLDSEASLNLANDEGVTPLMAAALNDRAAIASFLLKGGADSSQRDRAGKSAWDHARASRYSVLAELISKHARESRRKRM